MRPERRSVGNHLHHELTVLPNRNGSSNEPFLFGDITYPSVGEGVGVVAGSVGGGSSEGSGVAEMLGDGSSLGSGMMLGVGAADSEASGVTEGVSEADGGRGVAVGDGSPTGASDHTVLASRTASDIQLNRMSVDAGALSTMVKPRSSWSTTRKRMSSAKSASQSALSVAVVCAIVALTTGGTR